MAYVYDPNISDEENKKREQEQILSASGGTITGGGGGGAPAGSAAKAPTASGSFVNLQRYLDENRPQAGQLGEKVAAKVGDMGKEAQTAAETAVSSFQQKAVAPELDESVVAAAKERPLEVAADPAQLAKFKAMYGAGYSGPKSLEETPEFVTAQEKVKKMSDISGLTGTEAGRMELLKEVSAPGMGRGKLTLNQLLLSEDPGARGKLEGAVEPYKGLSDYLAAAGEEASKLAAQRTSEADAVQSKAKEAMTGDTGAMTAVQKSINDRVAAAEKDRLDTNDLLSRIERYVAGDRGVDLSDWLPSPEQKQWWDNFVTNRISKEPNWREVFFPGQFVNNMPAEAATVATADDYAKFKALEQLMGYDDPLLDVNQAGMAGTFKPSSIGNFRFSVPVDTSNTFNKPPPPNIPANVQDVLNANPGWTYLDEFGDNKTPRFEDAEGRIRYGNGTYWVPGMV